MVRVETIDVPEKGETSLKFGTSGLRGLVTELNGVPASPILTHSRRCSRKTVRLLRPRGVCW